MCLCVCVCLCVFVYVCVWCHYCIQQSLIAQRLRFPHVAIVAFHASKWTAFRVLQLFAHVASDLVRRSRVRLSRPCALLRLEGLRGNCGDVGLQQRAGADAADGGHASLGGQGENATAADTADAASNATSNTAANAAAAAAQK